MKKQKLTLAAGAALAASMALVPAAGASDNPFGLQKLDGGYQLAQADKAKDGKCGGDKKADGKCGAAKADKKKDGKCGEGKCGGDKKK